MQKWSKKVVRIEMNNDAKFAIEMLTIAPNATLAISNLTTQIAARRHKTGE